MTRRTAFLGPPGTFSEEAAMRHDGSAELLPLASIAEVFEAVSSGRADQGVAPFESTLGGPVAATAELLVHRPGVVVRGRLDLPTDHCLVSRKGVSASDVSVVYSHPQALAECRAYLERCLPQAEQAASASTAAALDDMERCGEPSAAICSQRAAEGRAEIIAYRIQDRPDNITRFIVLAPFRAQTGGTMKELSAKDIQIIADILGVPVGPEELDEVLARFNGLLWTMDKIDSLEWQGVDPVTWVSRPEDV